jgi:hypothetical protein
MKQLGIIIETFRSAESQFLLSGSKKTIILQDNVNTTDLLLAEIKTQAGINKMASEKIFINGKEATGAIVLDEIKNIRYAGYVKDDLGATEEMAKMSGDPSRFSRINKEQFLASKKSN